MMYLLIISLILYLAVYYLWLSAKIPLERIENKSEEPSKKQTFSIIIALRNESKQVYQLLESLSLISYNPDDYEIILIDDHSTDHTYNLLEQYSAKHSHIHIAQNSIESHGKKAALNYGISLASKDVIVCTDADCRFSPLWLEALNTHFENKQIGAVLGPVQMTDNGKLLSIFQVIDFTMMQVATALSVYRSQLFLANGANISYRKYLYKSVNGFEGNQYIASGDDILLLHKLKSECKFDFAWQKKAIVITTAEDSIHQFIQQRLRWASKVNVYPNGYGKMVSLIFAIFNLNLFITGLMCLLHCFAWQSWIIVVCIKFLAEAILLSRGKSLYAIPQSYYLWLLVLQPVHIIYMVSIGILSQIKSYKWKDR